MRNDTLTIMKKEFARFFGDRRMVFTTILMPGLMIFVLYSFMGQTLMKNFTVADDYVSKCYVANMPSELEPMLNELPVEWIPADASEAVAKDDGSVLDEDIDLFVVFPENFMADVDAYDIASGEAAPNVRIFYNSTDTESSAMYSMMVSVLDQFEASFANRFDVNRPDVTESVEYDQATEEEATGFLFSMMMPMLLMMFLYSGCMGIAPDSIAGEKERGTIATLLVTPMKRSSLAWGKILSLSAIALLSGASSFLGTMLSLPKLMGGELDGINTNVYGAKDYMMLLLLILTTVLVMISIIAVISAYAKSIKEAGTLLVPFMLIIMAVGVSSMFGGSGDKAWYMYLIPLYNTSACMKDIFSFHYSVSSILIAAGSNIAVSGLITYLLTKMFNSEKIMFAR